MAGTVFGSQRAWRLAPRGLLVAGTAPAERDHPRPFDGSRIPEKPDFGWAAGRSQLEPLLERREAGEWWKPLLKEQEGVGVDGDPAAPAAKISQAPACIKLPSRQSLRKGCRQSLRQKSDIEEISEPINN